MTTVPKQLRDAAEKIYSGQNTRPVKVRTFLSWFGAQRRGPQVVTEIQAGLKKAKLATDPDFLAAGLDERVRLCPTAGHSAEKTSRVENELKISRTSDKNPSKQEVAANDLLEAQLLDPTPRVGMICGANKLVSVRPEETIKHAVTLMLKHDYSQLPVMSSSRNVNGFISWKSLGKQVNVKKKDCEFVKDCVDDEYEVLKWNTSLWKAIKTIADKDVVLVKDAHNEIIGIVTSYDLAEQYHNLSEPFFLLSEIENNLKRIVELAGFTTAELEAAKDPKDMARKVDKPSKLSFGEVVRMLDTPKNWDKIHLQLDRRTFLAEIREINKIRNDVMHFSTDPIEESALRSLRRAAKMLRDLSLFN